VTLYRCLECDQIHEFQQLVIEHEQLLAEHKRLQSAPFSASEHTEHRRQIAAHGAKVAAFPPPRIRPEVRIIEVAAHEDPAPAHGEMARGLGGRRPAGAHVPKSEWWLSRRRGS
jgi:hypothetical protein